MAELGNAWLATKYFDEVSLQYRTIWDLYIKWYTVFLTANVLGLGATVQYVHSGKRTWIVVAFVVQNMLAASTAVAIALYSRSSARRMTELASLIVSFGPPHESLSPELRKSPFAEDLAFFAGLANALGNISLSVCWIAVIHV